MNIHLIAIGGSAMHNMALALHHKGYHISGSDDAIFSPSKERLEKHHLIPEKMGWFPEKITPDLDAIILGMHARIDNPELKRAKELNIPIIASGGAGTVQHFVDAFKIGKSDAALAASVFHFGEIAILDLKQSLKEYNIPVRI